MTPVTDALLHIEQCLSDLTPAQQDYIAQTVDFYTNLLLRLSRPGAVDLLVDLEKIVELGSVAILGFEVDRAPLPVQQAAEEGS